MSLLMTLDMNREQQSLYSAYWTVYWTRVRQNGRLQCSISGRNF